jgi:osmotically inducible protein OsmC
MIQKYGSANWKGGLRDGQGQVSTETGSLSGQSYSFAKRFGDEKGTNPEELIGAAHAACFSMQLSGVLGAAGLTADKISTSAAITGEMEGGGFVIKTSHLTVTARVPGATEASFKEAAEKAKAICPVSKVLNASITMDATLEA